MPGDTFSGQKGRKCLSVCVLLIAQSIFFFEDPENSKTLVLMIKARPWVLVCLHAHKGFADFAPILLSGAMSPLLRCGVLSLA